MTRRCAAVGLSALLALVCLALPSSAQTKPSTTKFSGPFAYDITKEVTLSGTVSSLVAKPEPGMIMGAHLLIETGSGVVDASLGMFALQGRDALSVSSGQQVAVTGVMKTINDRQVFLVRTVKTGSETFTVRNEHGLMLSPQTREYLKEHSGETGVQR